MATSHLSLASLLILPAILALLAPPCSAYNILYSGQSLSAGQSLTEGSYVLTMQWDCNLVLYDSGNAIWSSRTYGRGTLCHLDMQSDGNLVIYNRNNNNNRAVWASGTYMGGSGNYVLVLQTDRNVVIYGGALWATGTNFRTAGVVISKNFAVVANASASAQVEKSP